MTTSKNLKICSDATDPCKSMHCLPLYFQHPFTYVLRPTSIQYLAVNGTVLINCSAFSASPRHGGIYVLGGQCMKCSPYHGSMRSHICLLIPCVRFVFDAKRGSHHVAPLLAQLSSNFRTAELAREVLFFVVFLTLNRVEYGYFNHVQRLPSLFASLVIDHLTA